MEWIQQVQLTRKGLHMTFSTSITKFSLIIRTVLVMALVAVMASVTVSQADAAAAHRGKKHHGKKHHAKKHHKKKHHHKAAPKLHPPPSAPPSNPAQPHVDTPPPAPLSEQLNLTDALPDGEGDPAAYVVYGPANAGGSGFSSYWPLDTGYRTTITEGPGGGWSHNTMYTHDAIDLGIPRGTTIRAGFTGVVARVNNGCAEGNRSCGSGYGNYVY